MESIDLSFFVKTKAEAQDFSSRLSTVRERVYQTNFSLKRELLENLGIKKQEKFLELMRSHSISENSASEIQGFLNTILEHVAKLPVLSISLAIEPTEQTLQILSDWIMMNIKRQILLDVTVDQKIIAGTSITFNGKFLDISIRPAYEKMLAEVMHPPQPAPSPPPAKPAMTGAAHISIGR